MYIHLRNIKLKDINQPHTKTTRLIPVHHIKSIILDDDEKVMKISIDGHDEVKLASINGDFQRVKDSYNEVVNIIRKESKIIEY